MMDEIARELNRHRRDLHRARGPIPLEIGQAAEKVELLPYFKSDEVARVLRIEIDRDHEGDWAHYLWRGMGISLFDDKHEGPRQFQGVDVYVVDRLPAPGWRIINPFAR